MFLLSISLSYAAECMADCTKGDNIYSKECEGSNGCRLLSDYCGGQPKNSDTKVMDRCRINLASGKGFVAGWYDLNLNAKFDLANMRCYDENNAVWAMTLDIRPGANDWNECAEGCQDQAYCSNCNHCADGFKNCDETSTDRGPSCDAIRESTLIEECESLPPENKDECYIINVKSEDDEKICQRNPDSPYIKKCYTRLAQVTKNTDFCTAAGRETCMIEVAAYNGAPEICNRIQSKVWFERCYLRLSVENLDTKYCGYMTESVNRDNCIMETAIELNDSKFCSGMENSAISERCYTKFAEMTGNGIHCMGIIDDLKRNSCLDNTYGCKEIVATKKKQECFNSMAQDTRYTIPCYSIDGQKERKSCIIKVGILNGDYSVCNKNMFCKARVWLRI